MPKPAGSDSILFQPLRIGSLTVPGRVYKTATSETRASAEGFVTDELIAFYEPLARGGTPLIITGNIYPRRDGQSTPRMTGADADDKVPGLARLVDAVHRHGSLFFAQVSHCGRQVATRSVGLDRAVSASAVTEPILGTRPRPLAAAEIAEVVAAYAAAAGRCQEAGFDGVQIHAAHGYLVNQFLTPHTNRRKDGYGGDPEGRLRFLLEVFRATRERVGAGYPVILKLNGSDALPLRRGLKTPALVEVARRLEAEGCDAVEVSVGHYESGLPVVRGRFLRLFRGMVRHGSARHLSKPRYLALRATWPLAALAANLLWPYREGFNLRYARQFKRRLATPVLCVGGWQHREAMERAIAAGSCDAVSSARAMIADPYLVRHLRDGTAGPRCVFCNECAGVVGGLPVDCYHPRVRAEKDRMLAAEGP